MNGEASRLRGSRGPHQRSAAPSTYGLRRRQLVVRRQWRADPSLLRWYPTWQLLDGYAFLDLTTVWEQAWVTRWMAQCDRGEGAIVELGAWLGATTHAISRGLTGRATPGRVHVYDHFRFDDIEERTAGTPLAGRHRDGDSSRPVFDLRRGRGPVTVHQGDVEDEIWDRGAIELLFVDLAKTWATWCHVRASFLRHVAVGGVVVQQDWAHANAPWLHLWHHRWRTHLRATAHIGHSSSLVFVLQTPLPPEAFDPDELSDYSPDQVQAAFGWAASLVAPDGRPNVLGAHVMLHSLHGDLDDGIDALIRGVAEVPVVQDLAEVAIPELARRLRAEDPPER